MRAVNTKFKQHLKKELGYRNYYELADAVGLGRREVNNLINRNTTTKNRGSTISRIETLHAHGVDVSLIGREAKEVHYSDMDRFVDPNTIYDKIHTKDLHSVVNFMLAALSPRQKEVLVLHYLEGHTLREIGLVIKVSGAQVLQIEQRAIRRLRNKFKKLVI